MKAHSLLDDGDLPIVELARIAMREGVRPRAAYQAHKWFARRLGITARALLVAGAAPAGASFWKAFYRGESWAGKTVLDPFVGGGVMLLEAHRLGAHVRGVDIEPVAAAISHFQTTLRDLPDLSQALEDLEREVGSELAPFYAGQDAQGQADTMLHAFWVQQVACGGCGVSYDAHPSYKLAWDDAHECQWIACRGCSQVLSTTTDMVAVDCNCGVRTATDGRGIDGGRATCPTCGHTEALIDYARRTGRRPQFRLFAMETIPAGQEQRVVQARRVLRSATDFDRARFDAAAARWRELVQAAPRVIPTGRIPTLRRADNRLIDYGYSDYAELFNPRQLLHAALLGQAIGRADPRVRDALAVAFSDHLTTNNMMCAYAGGWRRLTPLFSVRAYRHIARPIEINPWLRKNGRGTFPNAVRSVTRASRALSEPAEPTPKGLLRSVKDSRQGSAQIVCGDARRLAHIPDRTVDLVLTDPPYFDYIAYSELGHFFTPWMRRLGLIGGRTDASLPVGQLASARRTHTAFKRFAKHLTSAFSEIRRVAKPDARVVFTYQNLDGRGWRSIALAMAKAGVIPVKTFPLYGDSSASLHKHALSISWDAVLVCKIGRPIPGFRVTSADRDVGKVRAQAWADRLHARFLPFTDGDIANIAAASAIVEAFMHIDSKPLLRVRA